MVDGAANESFPHIKSLDPRVSALREHNNNIKNYLPWHERAFGLHSRKIIQLGELQRPHLSVLELGAGRYQSFIKRALTVSKGGGEYTAVDLDPAFVEEANEKIRLLAKDPERLHVKQGNGNMNLERMGVTPGSADVVIINSVAANATPRECYRMRETLEERSQKDTENDSLQKAVSFLQKFTASIPPSFPEQAPLQGVKSNTLLLVNAFLALKPDGKLVYAHNDQGMTHESTAEVRRLCEQIGFDYKKIHTYDPYYNSFNLVDAALVRPSKYDMGIVTAVK